MSNTIYLYLKTHNVTGLKYLGKTEKDPFKYQGSGKHWTRHINKHGYDVTTEILFETTDKEEFKKVGLEYSKKWNIVESKEFANLMEETGTGGFNPNAYTEEVNYKRSKIINYKQAGITQSKTKSNLEWKETIGKEANLKRVTNIDWKKLFSKRSETVNCSQWKETIGKEAIKKRKENTDYDAIAKKSSKMQNSAEWKETIGKIKSEKCSKIQNDPAWKAKNFKTCEHCGKKDLSPGNYKRWHGDNCKEKE